MRGHKLARLLITAALSLTVSGLAAEPTPVVLPACAAQPIILSRFGAAEPVVSGFSKVQLQRGAIELAADPVERGNHVARMTAAGRLFSEVGKADLILAYSPLGAGRVVEMRGRFFFPAGSRLDSVILMDLECASCGLDTNPGVRLYLRDGLLRVDRAKIGIQAAFLPDIGSGVRIGTWHDIRWEVTLGVGSRGRSRVYLDGTQVMDSRGTTVLSQAVVEQLAPITVMEQVDRFQIGLTANSNPVRQTLYLDDVSICSR